MANLSAELSQFFKARVLRTWLGYAKYCDKKNAIRVEVPHSVLDERLMHYFKERTTFFVHDPENKAKPGDAVLIRELEEKLTTVITHELIKVVYPRGDIRDPITGRLVTNVAYNDVRFRDEQDELIKYYGESPNRFKYEDAPPRGWQAGKRDITDKTVKVKFHDDGKRSPYEIPLRKNFGSEEFQYPE